MPAQSWVDMHAMTAARPCAVSDGKTLEQLRRQSGEAFFPRQIWARRSQSASARASLRVVGSAFSTHA